MSLIEKLKKIIEKSDTTITSVDFTYDLIIEELKNYEIEEIDLEIAGDEKLFQEKQQQATKKILSLINENDDVLKIVDKEGYNIGMLAAKLKLEDVVLRALDNMEASLQQSYIGKMNIGMYAAEYDLEKATIKALDNAEASLQQSTYRENIGMKAAKYGLEEATIKALDNYEASIQQDFWGYNIGMYAVQSRLEKASLKALDNEKASLQYTKQEQNTIGLMAVEKGMEKVALKALENPLACTHQNKFGRNIGMEAMMKRMENVGLKALDDYGAAIQIDDWGWNIGMFAAFAGVESCAMKSVFVDKARKQISFDYRHSIRSLAEAKDFKRVVEEIDKFGDNENLYEIKENNQLNDLDTPMA